MIYHRHTYAMVQEEELNKALCSNLASFTQFPCSLPNFMKCITCHCKTNAIKYLSDFILTSTFEEVSLKNAMI